MSDVSQWRIELGGTTALWARPEGFRTTDYGWLALSGFNSVEFNVAFCQVAGEGGAAVRQMIDDVLASKLPCLALLAGPALGDAQALIDATWTCIGSLPLMALERPPDVEPDPGVRRLVADDLAAAHGLIVESFGYERELAAVAVPEAVFETPGQSAWGLFEGDELVSTASTATVEGASGMWSLATPPRLQGTGRGRRLIRSIVAVEAGEGIRRWLGWCTPAGTRATASAGFREIERWQVWSRPRWVLGRS
jgi:GNAT superfamily N-acetyltransferase